MAKYAFNAVKFYARKQGACSVCGKHCQRRKVFWQTHSWFNRNLEGNVKDRDEIYDELRAEAWEWEQEPVTHAKCEKA